VQAALLILLGLDRGGASAPLDEFVSLSCRQHCTRLLLMTASTSAAS
jgi:hypothetical protein